MNITDKKLEILNSIYKSKDGASWNETSERIDELIYIAKTQQEECKTDCTADNEECEAHLLKKQGCRGCFYNTPAEKKHNMSHNKCLKCGNNTVMLKNDEYYCTSPNCNWNAFIIHKPQ